MRFSIWNDYKLLTSLSRSTLRGGVIKELISVVGEDSTKNTEEQTNEL